MVETTDGASKQNVFLYPVDDSESAQEETEIAGRGGAAMCYLKPVPEKLGHSFLLTGGASRQEQFNDFWLVTVGLTQQGRVITKE